jgi:hypothetical protein
VRSAPSLSLLACGAAAAVALTGCANVSGGADTKDAVAPVSAVPSPLASLVKTDVGEYLVQPKKDISKKQIDATIAKLKTMKGVQSADLRADGYVDVQFYGNATTADHEAVVKLMGGLGDVQEGV